MTLTSFQMASAQTLSPKTDEQNLLTQATQLVQNFMNEHEIVKVDSWCMDNVPKTNCRSMVFYKNKKTGLLVRSFEDRFMVTSTSRSVASRCFYVEQEDGTFNSYVQDEFKNEVNITKIEKQNQGLTINFDDDGYPTRTLGFSKIGTSIILQAQLMYSRHNAAFLGPDIYAEYTRHVPKGCAVNKDNDIICDLENL